MTERIMNRIYFLNLEKQMPSDKIVTIATFTYPTEAYPLMMCLQNEGIKCELGDVNIVGVQPFLSHAVGGVKVNVNEDDLPRALELLRILDQEKNTSGFVADEKWKDYEKEDTFCPKCDEREVYSDKLPWFKTLFAVFLAFSYMPLRGQKNHYCANCGHKWKQ